MDTQATFPIKPRSFLRYAYLFLGIAFVLLMAQNYIRYGIHEGYRPLRSVGYLLNSLLLFIPLLPFALWGARRILLPNPKWFVWGAGIWTLLSIIVFYACSSIVLYFLGYYDEGLSSTYARYYFGREALIHLIVLVATMVYAWQSRPKEKAQKVLTGSLGRKKVQLPSQQVLWIESDDHYLKLHAKDMTLLARKTLREMAEELAPDFLRVHRKYLVNRAAIQGFVKDKRSDYVLLQNGVQVKIGKSFSHVLKEGGQYGEAP